LPKVIWTEAATRHLETIYAYLEVNSAFYATNTVNRLVLSADALGDFPELGQKVIESQDPTLRQRIEKPYRIIYRILDTRVEILAVIHGARDSFFEGMR
jgi:toxin ParE1/3/4